MVANKQNRSPREVEKREEPEDQVRRRERGQVRNVGFC